MQIWRLLISINWILSTKEMNPSRARKCDQLVANAFNQNSSNKETTTYDSPISTRVRLPFDLLANCELALHGVRNSRFTTFNQNSSNKETTTYDSPISTPVYGPCELWEFALYGVRNSRFSTFYQNSSNKETTTLPLTNLQTSTFLFTIFICTNTIKIQRHAKWNSKKNERLDRHDHDC